MQPAIDVCRQKMRILLDELPSAELRELYHFALFLHHHIGHEEIAGKMPSMPAGQLRSFAGSLAVGGDALLDAEALYD